MDAATRFFLLSFFSVVLLLFGVRAQQELPWWLVKDPGGSSAFGGGGGGGVGSTGGGYPKPVGGAGNLPVVGNTGFGAVPSVNNAGNNGVPSNLAGYPAGSNNGNIGLGGAGVPSTVAGYPAGSNINGNNGFGGAGVPSNVAGYPAGNNNGNIGIGGAGVPSNLAGYPAGSNNNGFGGAGVPSTVAGYPAGTNNNGFGGAGVPSTVAGYPTGINNGNINGLGGAGVPSTVAGYNNNGFGGVGDQFGGVQQTVHVGAVENLGQANHNGYVEETDLGSVFTTDGGVLGETSVDAALFEQSSYDPCFCPDGGLSCVCVVYYQCINGSISTSGYNLLDDRLSKPKVENCPGVQKCCREPLDNEIDLPPTPSVPPFIPDNTPTPTPPTVPSKTGCGVRRSPQSPNYDNTTSFSEFPWMLIVMQAEYVGDGSPPVDVFKCGASLIHPQVALTAAHCVHQILPSDLTVRAGEWDAQSSSEPLEAQDRRVSRVIKHPGFEKETLFNDIALLILDSPMKEAPNVDVTCLPQSTDDYTGVRCLATGWGTPRPDLEVFQTTLKKVEVPIVDRPSCQKRLRTTRLGRFFQLHKSFICAGGEPGVDTCKGDGGGPLFCPSREDPGRYIQVGVVSWGIGCGGTDTPAVYSSVPFFRDWVDDQLLVNGFENIAVPPPNVENEERIKN